MNQRIQELADQAEDYADGIVDQGGEFHPAYTQKFAELLTAELVEDFSKNFITVWYEQGLDIRGAELDKFMLRFAELSNA